MNRTLKSETEIKRRLRQELDDLAVYRGMDAQLPDEKICQGWAEALSWMLGKEASR